MKNRSRAEIVARIIETVNDNGEDGYGVTQTTIRYEVFLSSIQLKEYLISLTIHGLLSYDSTIRTYHAIKKGLQFLNIYYKIDDMVNKRQQQQKQQKQSLSSLVLQQAQMWINREEAGEE